MRRALGMTVLGSLLVLAAACIDVEESVTLSADLSGEASFSATADLEPMVETMANTMHSMAGTPGPATAAELEAARQQMMSQKGNQAQVPSVEELNQKMPPGLKVLETHADQQGTKVSGKVRVSFNSPSTLAQLNLSTSTGTDSRALDRPFSGLQVKDEGKTLLISIPLTNPLASGSHPGLDRTSRNAPSQVRTATGDDPTAAIGGLFKTMKFGFRLKTPFEVIETNATRRDGATLVWEYDWATLSQHNGDARGLFVRVRKPS